MAPATCIPVKALKDTSAFTEAVQSANGPVIVTKNGHDAFVSMSLDCYESLCVEAARAKLYQAIDRAEEDFASGCTAEADAFSSRLRNRYGL